MEEGSTVEGYTRVQGRKGGFQQRGIGGGGRATKCGKELRVHEMWIRGYHCGVVGRGHSPGWRGANWEDRGRNRQWNRRNKRAIADALEPPSRVVVVKAGGRTDGGLGLEKD